MKSRLASKKNRASKHAAEMTEEKIDQVAARFRTLGEPMRLKILKTICDAEKSVQEIVAATGAGQANVSKHLSMMYEGGIVERRKDGLNCFYKLADESIFEICQLASKGIEKSLAAKLHRLQSPK